VSHLQLKQAGQQFGIVDVGAVRRVQIAAGAGVHADALALVGGKSRERQVVQIDEAMQQPARGVDLHREARLGEVDLDLVGAFGPTAPDLDLVLGQQIVDELLARISR